METSIPRTEEAQGFFSLLRNRLLLAVTFGHLATDIFANLLPVAYPLLMSSLSLNYKMVGLVGTVFICVASLSQPAFGFLADRVPTRFLAAFGIAWIATLMGSIGLAWDYTSLIGFVCLAALGNAAFHPQGAMNASMVSGKQRASGVSIFMLGGTLGFALAPLVGAQLITNRGLSGLMLLAVPGVIAAMLVGLAMWRYEPGPRAAEVAAAGTARRQKVASETRVSLSGISLLVLIVALRSWAYQSIVSYTPLLMTGKGYELTVASQILFFGLIGASVGMLGGGLLADRAGRIRTCFVTLLLTAPAIYLYLATDGILAVVFLVAAGFLVDASHPATVVMGQEMMPRSAGLASGLILGLAFVAGGIGAFITGAIADAVGLQNAMMLLVIFPAAAAFLTLLLQRIAPSISQAPD